MGAEAAPPIFVDFYCHKKGFNDFSYNDHDNDMRGDQMTQLRIIRVVKNGTQIHMCSYGCH
jgi:hypothetical protein